MMLLPQPLRSLVRRAGLSPLLATLAATIVVAAGLSLLFSSLFPPEVRAAGMPVRDLRDGARSVRVNGFDLWYREVGKRNGKAAIVVLHGGPGMSDRYFNDVFDYLSTTHRVIYYDQRGSGFSEIKPNPAYYRFSYLVDDLEALRSRVIRQDKLILVAHSFGGMIAMQYAADHPDHVAGLILISSMPPRDWGSRVDPDGAHFEDWYLSMDPASRDRAFLTSYLSSIPESLYDPASAIVPQVGYMSYVPARLLWDTSAGYDFTKALSRLKVPALITYGAADTFVDRVPAYLHSVLSGSVMVRFERSGHWAFLEEPERFKAVVSWFLKRANL